MFFPALHAHRPGAILRVDSILLTALRGIAALTAELPGARPFAGIYTIMLRLGFCHSSRSHQTAASIAVGARLTSGCRPSMRCTERLWQIFGGFGHHGFGVAELDSLGVATRVVFNESFFPDFSSFMPLSSFPVLAPRSGSRFPARHRLSQLAVLS